MKLIIAGGRDYQFTPEDIRRLDQLHLGFAITEVVSGKAPGADTCGAAWAKANNIPVAPFPAKWDDISSPNAKVRTRPNGIKYNVLAGFWRNTDMAKYADAVALFPGGGGTNHMRQEAKKHKLMIFDFG